MTDAQDKELSVSAIGDTFRQIIGHMKGGFPVWEDFIARGMKFQKQLEQSIVAYNSFLEGLSKIAELAAHAKGGTRELGTGMTNVVMWHKGQELRLREMNQALSSKLLAPLQVKVEEWKKTTSQLDKDHEKEVQKSVKEIKESTKNTVKVTKNLESKLKKDKPMEKCKPLQQQLEQFQQETDRRIKETEERERRNLSRVLLEERSWFCGFITAFGKVLDIEIGMVGDLERLQVIQKDLTTTISRPSILPEATRVFVEKWTIPASPAIGRKRTGTESAPAPPPLPTTKGQNSPKLPPPPPCPAPPPPHSHYPPPPVGNFPLEASTDHEYEPPATWMSASFPQVSSMERYEPVTMSANSPREFSSDHYEPLSMSVSPSQASLMSTSSHQSTESSRSLSPPVGPTRSPAQSRTQLVSLQEEENAPSNFQLALLNNMRSRVKSTESSDTESPPVNARSSSLGTRPAPPPVATRPPRLPPPAVAQKPPRNHSPLEVSVSANGHHSPQPPQHHVLNQYSNEDDNSSSEDDSPLAKAIRQKKLRKTPQVNDRSNPLLSSR